MVTSQRMLAAARSWRRQGMNVPLGSPERAQLCRCLDFGSRETIIASRTVKEYIQTTRWVVLDTEVLRHSYSDTDYWGGGPLKEEEVSAWDRNTIFDFDLLFLRYMRHLIIYIQ